MHPVVGIVTTGVESIFNEPPLSYWRTQPRNFNFGCTSLFAIRNAKSSVEWVAQEPGIPDIK